MKPYISGAHVQCQFGVIYHFWHVTDVAHTHVAHITDLAHTHVAHITYVAHTRAAHHGNALWHNGQPA